MPHDPSSQLYHDVVAVTRDLLDHCKSNGQTLHLETGQETADGLVQFISDVERDNLFVNFDPANMILYGTGEPIEALQKIGPLVRSIHCKDAKWGDSPGKEWGQEVRLGDGDVGMEAYLRTLQEIGYDGPLTIEREIPQEADRQKEEIGHAVGLLTELRTKDSRLRSPRDLGKSVDLPRLPSRCPLENDHLQVVVAETLDRCRSRLKAAPSYLAALSFSLNTLRNFSSLGTITA